MVLDEALEERIARDRAAAGETLAEPRQRGDPSRPTASRRRSPRARRCSSRWAPRPGWSSRRARRPRGGPTVVVLPGPPRELQPMWGQAVETEALRAALRGRDDVPPADAAAVRDPRVGDRRDAARGRARGRRARAPGDHDVPETRRDRGRDALRARRRGAPTRRSSRSSRAPRRHAVLAATAARWTSRSRRSAREHGRGVAGRAVHTIATAESCTGGLLAARLTELPGSSEYVKGGDRRLLERGQGRAGRRARGVDRSARRRLRRRSREALADGARARLGADVGVGVTGVAGPGGGSEEKPVGLVWLSVAVGVDGTDAHLTRSVNLPGGALRRARSRDHGGDAPDPPRPARATERDALASPGRCPAEPQPGCSWRSSCRHRYARGWPHGRAMRRAGLESAGEGSTRCACSIPTRCT